MAVTSDQDVNWKVTQGDTFSLELQYVDPDDNPINIEGYSVVMEVKDKPGGRILSARCTVGDGVDITDEINGIITVTVSPEKTRKFNYPRSSYQIQGTDQYGENTTFLQGWFQVNAGTID
jgi:hypothetical protein